MSLSDTFATDVAAVQAIPAVPAILEVICLTTGMGFAAVARVTEDHWVACSVRDTIAFGLGPGDELDVGTTICDEIRQSREAVVIDHVAADVAFAQHPTPARYGFQSYISVPIILPGGAFFGTLCAIDPNPARLNTPRVTGMFKLFAELIAFHLDAHSQLAASHATLTDERRTAELREQFIAVLGHDLRNPLASIEAGAQMLAKRPHDERSTGIVAMIGASAWRMAALIDNLMDFARGRLGGGLALDRRPADLRPVIVQVADELRAAHPATSIEVEITSDVTVFCDPVRIGQLLSNLLGNALKHGAAGAPVTVRAGTTGGTFELTVRNLGRAIPASQIERLFEPFERGVAGAGQQGLGLGLYIASEIAGAHGGRLEAASTEAETAFTFRMPSGRIPPDPMPFGA